MTYHATINKLKKIEPDLPDHSTKLNAVFIVCDRMEPYMSYLEKYRPEIFEQSSNISGKNDRVANLDFCDLEMVSEISPDKLNHKLGNDRKIKLIDIRGNHAFNRGHINGSINIHEELFTQVIEQGNIFSPDDMVVICCPHGTFSVKYAAFLIKQGISSYSLKGGLKKWVAQGYPLKKMEKDNKDFRFLAA
jgi:cysteine synthase B